MTTTHPAELNNGVWTSWLPVTTTWSSHSACNSAIWARSDIQPSINYWPYLYDPAYGQSVVNTLTCLPPQATSWWAGDVTSSGVVTRFSLGPVVCPEAYTTASTIIVSEISTSVICCPTNFGFVRNLAANGGIDGICSSQMVSGQTIVYASPTTEGYASTTTTYSASGFLLAVPVEGYNFATVSPSVSPKTTTSASDITANPTTASLVSISLLPTTTPSSSGKGSSTLSTSAKAGIGAGAAVFALIVAAVVAAVVIVRRRRKLEVPEGISELHNNGLYKRPLMTENGPHELHEDSRVELDANGSSAGHRSS